MKQRLTNNMLVCASILSVSCHTIQQSLNHHIYFSVIFHGGFQTRHCKCLKQDTYSKSGISVSFIVSAQY